MRGPSTINPMLNYLESTLNELLNQGKVNYDVAALVDRLPLSKVPDTDVHDRRGRKAPRHLCRGPARTRVAPRAGWFAAR